MRILLLVTAIALSGCGTVPNGELAIVQKALDAILPRDFKGDFFIGHTNPYVKGSIRAGALRRGSSGWEFDWLVYYRDGWASSGAIRLGAVPVEFIQ